MFPSFRLGTLFGFPIRVNLSFLLFLGAVFIWAGGLSGLTIALIAAGSVLLHELGHALMARRLAVPVAGIELHFFGGAAQMSDMPRSPRDEMLVAAAGPAVSFALGVLGYALAALTATPQFALFGLINLMLGAFNLLPAFPSDGGRILRAWLARRRGLVGATELAVKVSGVVCAALVGLGIVYGSLQLVLVAAVLWLMGRGERLAARLRGDSGLWRGDGSVAGPFAGPRGTQVAPSVEYFPPATRWAIHPVEPRAPARVVIKVWR